MLTGISTLLFGGRLLVRSIVLKSFHLDDVFSILAWFFMLVSVICATIENPLTYQYSSIVIGETPAPSPADVANMAITLRRWNVGVQTLFWTSLYCVKLSFMFLYRAVLRWNASYKHRAIWSVALIYIILSYGVCLIGVYGQCGDAHNLFTYGKDHIDFTAPLRFTY